MRVFMCYSHKDSPFVDRLVKDLRRSGISVWRDVDDLPNSVQANTASWRDAVDQALSECSHLIVVLSPDSAESSEVKSEWNAFLSDNKPVIPVVARECKIPYRLKSLQYYEFSRLGYEPTFQTLYGALTGVPVRERTKEVPTIPPAPRQQRPVMPQPRAGQVYPVQQYSGGVQRGVPVRRSGAGRSLLLTLAIILEVFVMMGCACWLFLALVNSGYY